MQLVAAAKMKKAQDQASNGRAYAEMLNKVLVNLKEHAEEGVHPFFSEGKGDKTLVLLIASRQRSLRRFEHQPVQEAHHHQHRRRRRLRHHRQEGRSGHQPSPSHLLADFPIKDPAKFAEVRAVGRFVQEKFRSGDYKKVLVVFNNFINTVTIVPTVEQLLPVNPVTLGGKRDFGHGGRNSRRHRCDRVHL
jgi:F-type H+-transporting ATPase subunit gamma